MSKWRKVYVVAISATEAELLAQERILPCRVHQTMRAAQRHLELTGTRLHYGIYTVKLPAK